MAGKSVHASFKRKLIDLQEEKWSQDKVKWFIEEFPDGGKLKTIYLCL